MDLMDLVDCSEDHSSEEEAEKPDEEYESMYSPIKKKIILKY